MIPELINNIPDEVEISDNDLRRYLPQLALGLLKRIKAYHGFEKAQVSEKRAIIENNGHGKRENYGVPSTAFEFVDALGADVHGTCDTEVDIKALDFDLNLYKEGPEPIIERVDISLCCGGETPHPFVSYTQDSGREFYNNWGALRRIDALTKSIPVSEITPLISINQTALA